MNVCACLPPCTRVLCCVPSLAAGNSAAVSPHSHALLQVRGKLLSPERPLAVGALAVHVLLQGLGSVAEDVQTL